MSFSQIVGGAWQRLVRASQISGSSQITQVTSGVSGQSFGSSAHCTLLSHLPCETLQKRPGPHCWLLVHCTQRPSGSQVSPWTQAASCWLCRHSLVSTKQSAPPSHAPVSTQLVHSTANALQV